MPGSHNSTKYYTNLYRLFLIIARINVQGYINAKLCHLHANVESKANMYT